MDGLAEFEQACLLGEELASLLVFFVVFQLRAQAVELRLHAREVLPEVGRREAQVDGVLPELFDPHLQDAEGILQEGEGCRGHGRQIFANLRERGTNF